LQAWLQIFSIASVQLFDLTGKYSRSMSDASAPDIDSCQLMNVAIAIFFYIS
jgi:hypothetical protein